MTHFSRGRDLLSRPPRYAPSASPAMNTASTTAWAVWVALVMLASQRVQANW